MKRMVWIACILLLISGCIFDSNDSSTFDITGSWYNVESGVEMYFVPDKTMFVRVLYEGEHKIAYTGVWSFDGKSGMIQYSGMEVPFVITGGQLIFNNRVNDARYCWVRR